MARVFVFSDNLANRVEIEANPLDGTFSAYCYGCSNLVDLVGGTHEGASLEDTEQVAEIHVDSCDRCAKDSCTAPRPHDLGHRCRVAS